MRLILIGCEYVGTTTLADKLEAWALEKMDPFWTDIDRMRQLTHGKAQVC